MTTEAATTPAQAGSDSVQPSISLEDAANIDFYDPGEEPETVEAEEEQNSETETDEAEGQETDETEASDGDDDAETGEETGEEDEASTPEPDDALAIIVDGHTLTLGELKKGYFREADYTRQKQAVSTKEKSLEAMTARVSQTVEAVADFLMKQIPPAPDPQLAMTHPSQFVQQKAMHDAAAAQINSLLAKAGEVKAVTKELSDEQKRELLSQENAKLAEIFPTTTTKEGRQQFFQTAATAAKELGYSDAEVGGVMDHRMFALAHYASIGMRAEKAREKAKAKVQNVPPVAPPKAQKQGNAAAVRRNQDAMKRLSRTGSIADAMAVDFD